MREADEIRYTARIVLSQRSTGGDTDSQVAYAAVVAQALQAIPDPVRRAMHTVAVFGSEPEDVGPDEWLSIVAEGR